MLSRRTKQSVGAVDHELELVLGFMFVRGISYYLGYAKSFPQIDTHFSLNRVPKQGIKYCGE